MFGGLPTNIDEYVKKLDEKIAELEREEQAEKEKQQKVAEEKVEIKEKTQEEIQKEISDIFNHNLKEDPSVKDDKPKDGNIENPKVNVDVDSIVKNNDAKDEDFFDDFFGSE